MKWRLHRLPAQRHKIRVSMSRWIFLFSISVLTAFCADRPLVKIALVGDSTVNDEGGWGPGFRASFDSRVEVLNFALNGRSSKSFRDEKRWEPVLAAKPDYVLIQFGHNDGPGKGPERETDPKTTFRDNLARYIDEAKAAGAKPVLITSIVRRVFDAQGKIRRDSLVPYVEATRELASAKGVPLLDLYTLTRKQAEDLGPAATEPLGARTKDGKLDTTHLGPLGQKEIGVIAAHEMVKADPALQPYLHELVSWRDAMRQKSAWYGSAEAIRIADNLLVYQHDNGGWEKNIDMALPLGSATRAAALATKKEAHTTIDNDATYTQMNFLARVFSATSRTEYKDGFERGLDYVLKAQYPNGGWPQFYPLRHGYWDHITYNDDAMVGVLETLRAIERKEHDYAFASDVDRAKCRAAIAKAVECILKTQVVVAGKPTVWCAQHDEHTLEPAMARKYELPSLSGAESVGVVHFLMGIEHPAPEVIRAVEGAVAWFNASKIAGIRVEHKPAPGSPKGWDSVVVADASAPPLWARFYEIGTNRPIFSGRDSVKKYALAEIEYERRNGYRWYVDRPAKLLGQEYPDWKQKNHIQ
jgi:PelA/Pel-15E family pectate lyase